MPNNKIWSFIWQIDLCSRNLLIFPMAIWSIQPAFIYPNLTSILCSGFIQKFNHSTTKSNVYKHHFKIGLHHQMRLQVYHQFFMTNHSKANNSITLVIDCALLYIQSGNHISLPLIITYATLTYLTRSGPPLDSGLCLFENTSFLFGNSFYLPYNFMHHINNTIASILRCYQPFLVQLQFSFALQQCSQISVSSKAVIKSNLFTRLFDLSTTSYQRRIT